MLRKMMMLVAAAAAVLATMAAAEAREVTTTPDGRRVMVSKTVDGEFWQVTLDLDRADVAGNVLLPGLYRSFIWCDVLDISTIDPRRGIYTLGCREAHGPSRNDWRSIGTAYVPASFFFGSSYGSASRAFLESTESLLD